MNPENPEVKKAWQEIVRREPRLLALYERARAVKDDKSKEAFCANRAWYADLKPELLGLVGYGREGEDSFLGSSRAYEVAYHTIYNALPDCRDCGEISLEALMAVR